MKRKASQNNKPYLTMRTDQVKKDGTQSIILRITFSSRKKDYATGISCPKAFFNETTGEISPDYPKSEEYNHALKTLVKKAQDILFNDFYLRGKVATSDEFGRLFMNSNKDSFISFIEQEIETEKRLNKVAPGTMKNYRQNLAVLKQWRPEILFTDLTVSLLQEFEIHLKNIKGNKPNTIHQKMRFIKNFNNRAIRQERTNLYPFKIFRLTTEKTKKVFLLKSELQMLTDYFETLSASHKHRSTLRAFLFSCYTGLRYGDMKALRFKNIKDGVLYIKMEKTGDHLVMPLVDQAKKLMGETKPGEFRVFDIPTNQSANRSLKDIARCAGINKDLKFHSSRHSFATLLLNTGVDLKTVSKLMGHSSVQQTELYAELLQETMNESMRRFQEALKISQE